MTRRGGLLFLALSVIWGIPYLLIKVVVRELTPASLVFLRTALGTLGNPTGTGIDGDRRGSLSLKPGVLCVPGV